MPPDDLNNFDNYEKYLKLKVEINKNPAKSIDGVDNEFVFRLVQDFLMELLEPFLEESGQRVKKIIGDANLCKYRKAKFS